MKTVFFLIALLCTKGLFGQSSTAVSIIDFVKIKDGRRQESLFYYEHNWKVYRDTALERGYIKSYKLLTTTADTTAQFDLLLLTEYADSVQYKLSEERFQQIISEIRPGEPKLLNNLKPNDFRQNVFFKQTQTLFSAGRKE